MTTSFESITKGLSEAVALNTGQSVEAKVHSLPSIDVGKLRRNLGLSQVDFASKLRISVATLRHWERGDRKPHGPALALLHVVAKEPSIVMKALKG